MNAAEILRRSAAGTLDFLPAGRMSNVTELLDRPEMVKLLEDLLVQYDRIIIDSPPVLAVSDARVVARLADRLIFLVRWNSTPRDAVRNGLKLLRGVGITVSGIVLSQVNQRKHARYGYGDFGQYYGRYREYYGE
jgi:succinoglycan biosynthesis transport protein ExoP